MQPTALSPTSKRPLYLQTRVYRCGSKLKAVTHMVIDGHPRVINAEVDLKPIARQLARRARNQARIHGERITVGKFGDKFKRWVDKVGKSKLVKDISKGVQQVGKIAKDVIKSPITKGIVGGVAAVFPPVGVPALAALATANVAISVVDQAGRVAKTVGNAVDTVKRGAQVVQAVAKLPKNKRRAALERNPRAATVLRQTASAKRTIAKAKANRGSLMLLKARSDKAKAQLKKIALQAKFSKDPVKRDHARKLAAVVKIAVNARRQSELAAAKAKGAEQGLFFDKHGRMRRGRFRATAKGSSGFFYRGGKAATGSFEIQPASERSSAQKAADRLALAERNVKLARARNEQVSAYFKAKATAVDAAREYQRALHSGKRETVKDVKKAIASVKKAKRQGMSTPDRKRLTAQLKARLKAKKAERKAQLRLKKHAAMKSVEEARMRQAVAKKARISQKKARKIARRAEKEKRLKIKYAAKSRRKMQKTRLKEPNKSVAKGRPRRADKSRARVIARLKAQARLKARARVSGSDCVGCGDTVGYDCIQLA